MQELKRSLGLVECTLMGVGVMLGAGIYALVGQAASLAGNTVWVSFLVASVVASFTGLSYAELSSFIPKAGGEYYYVNRAFGRLVAFLVTWLLLVGIAVCSAAVALGFAGYLNALIGTDEIWTASFLVMATAALLIYGIKQSAWVAGFCTVLELLGLGIIIAIGLPKLGAIDCFEPAISGSSGTFAAAALVFFAYIGFEEIVQLAEETRDPEKNIPRSVLLSIAITTVLYVIVALCAISGLGWEKLGTSASPLADVAAVALGHQAFLLLAVIALFSTGNTVLILLMSAARLLYGMAEDGALPQALARIHKSRQSPYVATSAVAIIAIAMIASLRNIAVVANLSNFSLLVTFVIINSAVIVLRFREPQAARPFKIPGNVGSLPLVPVLGVVSSLFMLLFVGWKVIVIGTALCPY
ncbi:MAG: amino acid permease [Planctomycetes bacterium]|nr:amino acid permease [Planctomycetota bacterium]